MLGGVVSLTAELVGDIVLTEELGRVFLLHLVVAVVAVVSHSHSICVSWKAHQIHEQLRFGPFIRFGQPLSLAIRFHCLAA